MKIIVTGGNGMIGNNIKDIISNNSYSNNEFIFINRSLNNQLSVDLTNREDVLLFFEKFNFDYIIHLAADVGGLYKNINNNSSMFSKSSMFLITSLKLLIRAVAAITASASLILRFLLISIALSATC